MTCGDWIPVTDRLPDRNGEYLCIVDSWGDYIRQILYFYADAKHFRKRSLSAGHFFCSLAGAEYDGKDAENMTADVTHWMELPEVPDKV